MSSNGQGCKNCKHSYWCGGDIACDLNPHDFQTDLQKEIVKWLCYRFKFNDDAWTAGGCPGFKHFLDEVGDVE